MIVNSIQQVSVSLLVSEADMKLKLETWVKSLLFWTIIVQHLKTFLSYLAVAKSSSVKSCQLKSWALCPLLSFPPPPSRPAKFQIGLQREQKAA